MKHVIQKNRIDFLLKIAICFSLCLFFVVKEAYAYLEFEYNPTGQWLAEDLNRRQWENIKLDKKIKEREKRLAEENGGKRDDGENFKFNYDPALSPVARQAAINILIEFVRESGKMTAEIENDLNKAFGNMDIMQTIGAALQKKGHSPHSLATAVGYWMISHLQVAQDTDFTDQQLAAVVKQIEQQLKDTELPGDAEKQMAAEHLLWTATFQLLQYQDAKKTGSKQVQESLAYVSRTVLHNQFGMDADKMTITDKGLVLN